MTCREGLAVAWLLLGAPALGQGLVEVERLEREAATVAGEVERIEAAHRDVPDLFAPINREERLTWGAVHHLNKDHMRAALAMYAVVEPRVGEAPQASPEHAEAMYLLGDSLYEMGNVGAARVYFERLLTIGRHGWLDDAILRLMTIASNNGRFEDVDRYYAEYLAVAGQRVPAQVRYLHARSLFSAGRDAGALEELARIPTGDAWDLRARYLRVALLTRQGRSADALAVVDDALKQRATGAADRDVHEILLLARARLLYELDRLDESIDAYQEIGLDSRHLPTMLYEVTLTYVRRGQLAQRPVEGDGLGDALRREKATTEYKKALRQLEDLRALETGDRADSDLLAASLLLQVRDYDDAHERFADVAARFDAADQELQRLVDDVSVREQILKDILAIERDPRARLQSPLPALAARRAGRQRDVARSLQAFKEIQDTREQLAELERLLSALENALSADNPGRVEAFRSMRSAVEHSQAIANATTRLRSRALAAERAAVSPSASQAGRLAELAVARRTLEERIATLPQTMEAIEARRVAFRERLDALDRSIHDVDLATGQLRAAATATAWLAGHEPTLAPAQREFLRAEADREGADLGRADEVLDELRQQVSDLKAALDTLGGRGSGEERLRQDLNALLGEERALLAAVRGTASSDVLARVDRLHGTLDGVDARNAAFRSGLDASVDARLADARALLATERAALDASQGALAAVDAAAGDLRARATAVALERVRREVSAIVLRADVGIIDTAFARKQGETEAISALQRARAVELTDLTQAYADLTRDELP